MGRLHTTYLVSRQSRLGQIHRVNPSFFVTRSPGMASMASKAAPMASTFCTEYSAFVQGIIKGARVYLEDKPPETPFGLPDLPFHGAPPESEYDLRRMVLLERLIDRMIFVSV